MNRYEEMIVVTNAAAIRMKVSMLVGEGKPMEEAKTWAINKYDMNHIPANLRKPVIDLVGMFTYGDLYPDDAKAVRLRDWKALMDYGYPDTYINRFLHYWFGMVW